jgi:hypothetical protein
MRIRSALTKRGKVLIFQNPEFSLDAAHDTDGNCLYRATRETSRKLKESTLNMFDTNRQIRRHMRRKYLPCIRVYTRRDINRNDVKALSITPTPLNDLD